MLNIIKRIFSTLAWYYGPTAMTIFFALLQGFYFPDSPIWLIPLFFIFFMIALIIYNIIKIKR